MLIFIHYRSEYLYANAVTLDFLHSSVSKASACNAGDLGSILGWEDPMENEMATHSSILAWRIPWSEESGGLQSIGLKRVRHGWVTVTWRGYLEGWQCLKHLKFVAISFPVSWLFALMAETKGFKFCLGAFSYWRWRVKILAVFLLGDSSRVRERWCGRLNNLE